VISGHSTLRIGSRGSALALRQADRVVQAMQRHYPNLTCDVQVISTAGDRDKQTSLQVIGGQGVFAKELQTALLNDEIDIAVHSVKDLTSTLPPGLRLCTVFERADPRDVIISDIGGLKELPEGSTVGTSSRRRLALLKRLRPDLEVTDLRGNIDTRIGKVTSGPLDAAVLAAAGVLRMGWGDQIRQYLDIEEFVPAPGQGALGIEAREDNLRVQELLEPLHEPDTTLAIDTERAFLRAVGGGCTSPIGAHAVVDDQQVRFTGMLATEDLEQICIETRICSRNAAHDVAIGLASEMLQELAIETGTAR
jgi:hydroxymethylbilane synthase